MDTYQTTYRKDYLWPYVNTVQLRGPAHAVLQSPQQAGHPIVGAQYLVELPAQPRSVQGQCGCCGCRFSHLQHQTAPLLDVVVFPAKVGAAPETETSRYDQPNTFLRKLEEKYPYMFNVLKSTPPEELVAKVYRDRNITTYQADYCHMGDGQFPGDTYGNLLRAGGLAGMLPADFPVQLPDCSHRPLQRRAYRPNTISKLGCCHKDKEAHISKGPAASIVTGRWKSEYMDTVSRLGENIVRDKIHQHRGPGPGRRMKC